MQWMARQFARRRPFLCSGASDETGVTTLSWLLIVTAVAGLAALGVVLVSQTVDDTGAELKNPDPRIVAAQHQAHSVVQRSKAADANDFDTWSDWERYFDEHCRRIAVLYRDADATVSGTFKRASGGTAFDTAAAGHAAASDADTPSATKAQAVCTVR